VSLLLAFSPLGPVEDVLTALLEWLHASIGLTWGISIVVLTAIIRFLMVPLTVKQIHSMQKLQAFAPELKALQQKYKHDKQRQQQEVMAFYRENKVNPLASCLPILLQLPIFFALFFVLRDFEEEVYPQYPGSDLGFLGIVPSITEPLTSHWSGYLLLVIYVASQVGSTLLTPIQDKRQRYIFLALPIVAIFFVIHFPTGLMLYWSTTNLWTVGQGLITRRFMPRPQPPPKKSSRTEPQRKAGGDGDGGQAARATSAPKSGGSGSGQRKVRRRKKRGPQARR
jgi:YidC/Oxa1 family membrane protein insertase